MRTSNLTFDTVWAPHFDAHDNPVKTSIAIFSTPRTGSQSLCRLLYAMGLGVPAEYFLQRVMERYGERFLGGPPTVDATFTKAYVRAIADHRCRNGCISYKIHADQHRQVTADLGKAWEDTLPSLTIIRLRRRDIVAQAVSLGAALQTGIWDDASGELLKRPGALNENVAERWVDYIFRSEQYWDRYLRNTKHRVLTMFCEDFTKPEQLQTVLRALGTGHSSEEISRMLARLPRSSHNHQLSSDLAQRFGEHISQHWHKLMTKAGPFKQATP
ncbi:MAG: Stf0 family sulfotransferase [Pseudomonadota bacterium]